MHQQQQKSGLVTFLESGCFFFLAIFGTLTLLGIIGILSA